jgi:NADP-dependent 3-hydroxy acid dehydrogenase YdfG
MEKKLIGTVALVTGANGGIGGATARGFAEQGAAVAMVDLRKDRLDPLVREIVSKGGRAIAIEADLTKQDQAVSAVERTVRELGRLDTVFNGAGVMSFGPVVGASTEEWERMISVNMYALLYVSHAALPHLMKAAEDSPRRVADLINVSSLSGRKAVLNQGVYSMTKFGVVGFSESLRQEVSDKNVRVSLIEPGPVTKIEPAENRPEAHKQSIKHLEGIEWLQPEDIADAAVYIATRSRRVAISEMVILPTELGSR